MESPTMDDTIIAAPELATEANNNNSPSQQSVDGDAGPAWDDLMEDYETEYGFQEDALRDDMRRLVTQLLHGCGNTDCTSRFCATGIRNTTRIPVRDYTPRSARIIAFGLLTRSRGEDYICKHGDLIDQASHEMPDEGPRDPSSFSQRLADTSDMKQLAKGIEAAIFEDGETTAVLTWELHTLCEPPFQASGASNPFFVPNKEVADTVGTALQMFYDLIPSKSSPATWQTLAQHINNGRALPAATLDPKTDYSDLVSLLELFSWEPYIRLCAEICKVVALRTQVEDVTAKLRQPESSSDDHRSILSLLTDRVTLIARSQTASQQDSWVPWPYPLWFKKVFLKHWDGKPTIKRGTIACGALELLEMQQRIWDRSHPDRTSDANLLPYVYKRVDATELMRSWMERDTSAKMSSRHLLTFPFLYSDAQILMSFRMLNHLRMREAHKLSHVNEELYDRFIANSDRASLAWDNQARETHHLRDFYLLLTVRRDHILEDAFDQLWQRRKCELLRPLRVRLGEMEGTEVGQDLGGVQIEFFNLVCKALFSPDAGMFNTDTTTGLSYFRPGSLQPLYMFELFGLLVALALYNGITIPVNFPRALYNHLLGLQCTEFNDIQDGWPEIKRSLQSIKDGAYEGLDYEFPLEANGLRMSINKNGIDRVRKQCDEYVAGKRSALDLEVDEMSRIDAPSGSTKAYQLFDHRWPGWSIHAPPSDAGAQSKATDSQNTVPTPPRWPPTSAAEDENDHIVLTVDLLAQQMTSGSSFKRLMEDIASGKASGAQRSDFQNQLNGMSATVQSRAQSKPAKANPNPPPPAPPPRPSQELTPALLPAYIKDHIAWLTNLSVYPQLTSFAKGFHTLLPRHHLALFTPTTLSRTLSGTSTLDLPTLRSATQYQDYTASDPYIASFWRILASWSQEDQKALLRFVTAAERIPISGAQGLTFKIQRSFVLLQENLRDDGEIEALPTSSTCFGTLYLPKYRDEDTLERKLRVALEFGGVGFGTA